MGDTDRVARFVVSTGFDDLPPDVVDAAGTHVRDTLGVTLAGTTRDVGEIALDYVAAKDPGTDATFVGSGTASPAGAAFANGVLAHALEWDDTPAGPHHLSHPSAPTLPAASAAAELADAPGRETLAGYVTGVEVLSRLELASFPEHYYRGWHDTATYGVFGAAAVASAVLGLDREATADALGVAASCSAGLRKNNGTMTKPFHDCAMRSLTARRQNGSTRRRPTSRSGGRSTVSSTRSGPPTDDPLAFRPAPARTRRHISPGAPRRRRSLTCPGLRRPRLDDLSRRSFAGFSPVCRNCCEPAKLLARAQGSRCCNTYIQSFSHPATGDIRSLRR